MRRSVVFAGQKHDNVSGLQDSEGEHAWQAKPENPQALFWTPEWQTPSDPQHPLQFEPEHVGGLRHLREFGSHIKPLLEQFAQAKLPAPQASAVVPDRHTPLASQHPPGQVLTSHEGTD